MDGRRNGLGMIAIGLGVLALVVALIGQIGPRVSIDVDRFGTEGPRQFGQVQPRVVPPSQQRGGDTESVERGNPWGDRLQRDAGGPWAGGPGERWERHGGPHFLPFMFFGGLLKLLAALALIFLGLRLFRGGGGWGGPGRWNRHSAPQVHEPQPGDHKRQPIHTGETSYL